MMTVRIKPGVVMPPALVEHLVGAGTALPRIAMVVEKILCPLGQVTITSVLEGAHMPTSLHYRGRAMDVVVEGWPSRHDVVQTLRALREELGKDYDVVNESTHIHIEYDPKVKTA